jgi:hypothetical protein
MEAEAPDIAAAVHHAHNDGLRWGYAEVDAVLAVHGNAEAGAESIARVAGMAESGNFLQTIMKLANGSSSVPRVVQDNVCANGSDVTLRGRRDDQLLGADRSSPNFSMSARNSSASV